MRFIAALPLALAISVSAQAQTLTEAMQNALSVHPEIQSGINARSVSYTHLTLPTILLV